MARAMPVDALPCRSFGKGYLVKCDPDDFAIFIVDLLDVVSKIVA
jgi:hypothetical protein